jgi:hypothetical protein
VAARFGLFDLSNWCRLAKMLLFHGHTSAVAAHILHRRQFVLTDMGVVRLWSTAETAFGFIAARIA